MSASLIKIVITAVLGILSLTTTAVAGYRVYKNGTDEESVVITSPTPEVIETTEEVVEIEVIPSTKSATSTTLPTSLPASPIMTTTVSSQVPMASPKAFKDDDDDEVEFEDDEEDDDDEDEKEEDNEKDDD